VIRRIDRAISSLSEDPRPAGCKKPRSKSPDGWRIRVGDYRVLYQTDDAQRRVLVYRIGHRREVYE
jgi:mRNA interferase RelE/StbE